MFQSRGENQRCCTCRIYSLFIQNGEVKLKNYATLRDVMNDLFVCRLMHFELHLQDIAVESLIINCEGLHGYSTGVARLYFLWAKFH